MDTFPKIILLLFWPLREAAAWLVDLGLMIGWHYRKANTPWQRIRCIDWCVGFYLCVMLQNPFGFNLVQLSPLAAVSMFLFFSRMTEYALDLEESGNEYRLPRTPFWA